jgi:hypothetical protein
MKGFTFEFLDMKRLATVVWDIGGTDTFGAVSDFWKIAN